MIGYPFDSQVSYDPDTNEPIFDRAISSKPLRQIYKTMFTTGVFPNPSTNLQVTADSTSMNITVSAGACIVDGCVKIEEDDRTLAVQAASTQYDRIDTVVMRLNDNTDFRTCDLYILKGTASANPTRPELTRIGDIYEIGLADIFITKGITQISQEKVTDTRLDTERCGYVSSISEFDTTTLYNQIQDDLKNFKNVNEAEFDSWEQMTETDFYNWMESHKNDFNQWFDTIKGQLSEDAAGNLQNQINDTKNEIEKRFESVITDISIPNDSWVTTDDGNIMLTIDDEGVTEDTIVNINLDYDSLLVANACGLMSITESHNGYYNIYSEFTPSAPLSGKVIKEVLKNVW